MHSTRRSIILVPLFVQAHAADLALSFAEAAWPHFHRLGPLVATAFDFDQAVPLLASALTRFRGLGFSLSRAVLG